MDENGVWLFGSCGFTSLHRWPYCLCICWPLRSPQTTNCMMPNHSYTLLKTLPTLTLLDKKTKKTWNKNTKNRKSPAVCVLDHRHRPGEPCPDRIVEDLGGAFGMGAVGGFLWHFGRGARNSPQGDRLSGAASVFCCLFFLFFFF